MRTHFVSVGNINSREEIIYLSVYLETLWNECISCHYVQYASLFVAD